MLASIELHDTVNPCPICGNRVLVFLECGSSHLECKCGLKFYGTFSDISDVIDQFNNRKVYNYGGR